MRIHLTFAPVLAAAMFAPAAYGSASIKLAQPFPSVIRQGATVTVAGTVRKPGRHSKAVLESRRTKRWVMLANTRIGKRGAFALRWTVPGNEAIGPISLRVALIRGDAVVAATRPARSAVGSAPVPCAPPVPPAVEIPTGDGWIVGGAIGEGGPFPGFYACLSQPYTVTATDSSGNVQATQNVQGGHSYTLAPLPAGQYTLVAGACHGMATVTAGQQTTANTYCYYP